MTINLLHFSFRKPYYIYVITIFRFCSYYLVCILMTRLAGKGLNYYPEALECPKGSTR